MGASEKKIFKVDQIEDLFSLLNKSFQKEVGYVLLLSEPLPPKRAKLIESHSGILCFATGHGKWDLQNWPKYIQGYISDPDSEEQVSWAFEEARRVLDLRHENEQLKLKAQVEKDKLEQILSAALDLSGEREPQKLCERVLSIMRRLTAAEGASLYLADKEGAHLHFSHFQNEMIQTEKASFQLKIDESSMAGACAFRKKAIHVPDVYSIPATETFKFNRTLDDKTGYKTKAVLSFPILKSTGDLVGVIQLVNSKRGGIFTEEDIEIGQALSGHIAVSLETALLYQNIEQLFEGFIKASVTAIESRDPTTSGHSERVAKLTLALAQEVSVCPDKKFQNVTFNDVQLRELRYASLLHDFGKIGVPELVLLKEKKLYPEELREISRRLTILKIAHPERRAELETLWQGIVQANEPSVAFEKVKSSNLDTYVGQSVNVLGEEVALITPEEWKSLSIPRGSLTQEDRDRIESHVTHTFRFLSQIPWTRGLQRVPEIAHAHHEKLDGTGYPQKLKAESIPVESQIMAVSDIYDALTASDRPYKKSLTSEKALEILFGDAERGKIDGDLVTLFRDRKVFNILSRS